MNKPRMYSILGVFMLMGFFCTQETAGSGTFFYVVAAIKAKAGYIGSDGFFLGDRITPQSIEFGAGKEILVPYAERAYGEAFTMQPSIGKSICLFFDPKTMQFAEAMQDFEGKADPARMTLYRKPWIWISLLTGDRREVTPKQPNVFSLTFASGNTFSATTDCNSMIGNFEATNDTISFGPTAATKMFCEDSQEMAFTLLLESAKKFHFTPKGELILELDDGGAALFR